MILLQLIVFRLLFAKLFEWIIVKAVYKYLEKCTQNISQRPLMLPCSILYFLIHVSLRLAGVAISETCFILTMFFRGELKPS